jgi:hypothetical protein
VEKCGRAGQATDDSIIRRMRFACWLPKAIDTLLEYVILIASVWQQWLRERVYILCHTHIAFLVNFFSLLNISIILMDLFLPSNIITIIPNFTSSWYDWI